MRRFLRCNQRDAYRRHYHLRGPRREYSPGHNFGGTISKSLTIDCAGTAGSAAFNFSINGTGIVVVLRNLNISSIGLSGGSNGAGIDFQNGAALFVENCTIDSWNTGIGAGIHFAPTSGTAKLHVTDSVIRHNGVAAGGAGIFIAPTGGASTRIAIERTVVENNTYGIVVVGSGGTTLVEVKDSMIANNAINGIWAFSEHDHDHGRPQRIELQRWQWRRRVG